MKRAAFRSAMQCAEGEEPAKNAAAKPGTPAISPPACRSKGAAALITFREEINLSNYILYGFTIILLAVSFFKDKNKTKTALMKAWKSFENILPQFLVVLLLVGLMLAVLNPQLISKIIGSDSGWFGVALSGVVGAITLIPGFVAFPLAAMLLKGGAGYMQIGAFVSSLMMVGIVTLPVEIKYFGRKLSIMRNALAFIFSFIVALVIGLAVG